MRQIYLFNYRNPAIPRSRIYPVNWFYTLKIRECMITMICFQIVHQLEQVVISLIAKVLELSVMGKDQLFSPNAFCNAGI